MRKYENMKQSCNDLVSDKEKSGKSKTWPYLQFVWRRGQWRRSALAVAASDSEENRVVAGH